MLDHIKASNRPVLIYRKNAKMLCTFTLKAYMIQQCCTNLVLGGLLDPYDMQKVKWRIYCRRTLFVCKSMSCWNVLWSVQCNFHRSGGAQTLSRATRGEIERVLKLLFTKTAPSNDKLHSYERTINQAMLKRLHFRKDMLGRNWFKDHIREAFHAWSDNTETISQLRNNSHVTFCKILKVMVWVEYPTSSSWVLKWWRKWISIA